MLLYERLALYLKAGIPLAQGLLFGTEPPATPPVRRVLSGVLQGVLGGKPLAESMALYPRTFPQFERQMIELGEYGGTLTESLTRLATLLRRQRELRRTLVSALVYPAVISIGAILVSAFLVFVTFPKIVPVLEGLNTPLPLTTRVLITTSNFLSEYWLIILAAGAAVLMMGIIMLRRASVQAYVARLTLSLPVIGPLMRAYQAARQLRTLATLLGTGISMVPALAFLTNSAPPGPYRTALANIERGIHDGLTLSSSMAAYPRLFPRSAQQLVAAGESTGTLPVTLRSAAELFESEVAERSRALTALIEPVLMIGMGLSVGLIAIAIIAPIYGITQNLSATAP